MYGLLAPTAHWTTVGNSVMSKVYQSRQEYTTRIEEAWDQPAMLVKEVEGAWDKP